jgi:hypothetical protein
MKVVVFQEFNDRTMWVTKFDVFAIRKLLNKIINENDLLGLGDPDETFAVQQPDRDEPSDFMELSDDELLAHVKSGRCFIAARKPVKSFRDLEYDRFDLLPTIKGIE